MAKRSPNYPGVDLKFAVERAQRLWETQQTHPAAFEVVMKNLGYSARSGAGSVTFGALKRFGLLEDVEDRRSKLTPLGIEVVRGETTGQRDFDKLREAALFPKVHRAIWDQYGSDLPSDSVIVFDLEQKGFTAGGAAEFLGEWKRTMAFAKLAETGANVSSETDSQPENLEESAPMSSPTVQNPRPPTAQETPAQSVPLGSQTLSFPLMDGQWASLSVPIPMSEEAWEHFMRVLQTMKPAATARSFPTEPDSEG